jgi:hypothetical protein
MSLAAAEKKLLDQKLKKPRFDFEKNYASGQVIITKDKKNEFDDYYKITKYLQSDTTVWVKDMYFYHFDSVQFIKQSDLPNTNRVRAHFLAHRSEIDKKTGETRIHQTVLIGKQR